MSNEIVNKRKRIEYHKRKKSFCEECGSLTTKKFCSALCQHVNNRSKIFFLIENGISSFTTLVTSQRWFKKYLIFKHGEKCMECEWDKRNPNTGNVPIELEHIDGDHTNFDLSNLKLLCPNCHSLTPTYKGANRGKGRFERRLKYANGKSF